MISDKILEKLESLAWNDLKKFSKEVIKRKFKVISKVPVEELARKRFKPVYYRVILEDENKEKGIVFVPIDGKDCLEALS